MLGQANEDREWEGLLSPTIGTHSSSIPCVLGFRTMLALEIWLNGKKICTAGIQDRGVITSLTACIIRPEHSWCEFDVGGLIGRTDEHLEWAKEELAVGSEVTIKVVNADVADAPKSRQQLKSS